MQYDTHTKTWLETLKEEQRDKMAYVLKEGKKLSKLSAHDHDTTPHKTHVFEHGHVNVEEPSDSLF